jgi:biotin carboxyl carrier protein
MAPSATAPASEVPLDETSPVDTSSAGGPAGQTPPGQTPPASSRRPWSRTTKIGVAVVVVLALLEISALGTRYLTTDRLWVIADNAQVDGDEVQINAPTTGVVVDWSLDMGSPIRPHQSVGRIEIQGSGAQPKKPIRSPGSGTVAQTMVTEGMYVTAGSLLAVAYDPTSIYVTARVPEEEVSGVRVGAPVDIVVDASPGVPVTGTVAVVGAASAGASELENNTGADPLSREQSIYPGPDTDPQNPQRVDQYIPVKILFTHTGAARVTPGQNVTVHIHRR